MITYEEAIIHADYSQIPRRILQGVYDYVERHQEPGHFLRAVLVNDLFLAVGRADSESLKALEHLVVFLHMEVRSDCYGNQGKVSNWLRLK